MNTSSRLSKTIAALSITLALLGVIMVYSSSAFQTKSLSPRLVPAPGDQDLGLPSPILPLLQRSHGGAYSTLMYFAKQLLWTTLGIIALLVVSRIDYPRLRSLSRPLALGALVALFLLVLLSLGSEKRGPASWFTFRWFSIQPAEFAKIALVIFLADLLARRQSALQSSLFRSLALLVIPGLMVLLVILQPDLGMATVMILLSTGMWLLAGARLRHLVLAATLGALLLLAVFYHHPNARSRIETFIRPEQASEDSQYQVRQAKIGMARGGLWGVGLASGQQQLHFLPEPHTDFIFAILAEELGFVVSLAVLLAYGALIFAGLLVAIRTPDLFATLLAGGLSLMLALGVLTNIAVVTDCVPTTGLPLPLLSYGGSSLLSSMIALGIILNISKNLGGVAKS